MEILWKWKDRNKTALNLWKRKFHLVSHSLFVLIWEAQPAQLLHRQFTTKHIQTVFKQITMIHQYISIRHSWWQWWWCQFQWNCICWGDCGVGRTLVTNATRGVSWLDTLGLAKLPLFKQYQTIILIISLSSGTGRWGVILNIFSSLRLVAVHHSKNVYSNGMIGQWHDRELPNTLKLTHQSSWFAFGLIR